MNLSLSANNTRTF